MRFSCIPLCLITLLITLVGCGGKGPRVGSSTKTIEPLNEASSMFEYRIVDEEKIAPVSLEAAAVLKQRGDSVFVKGDTVYRGTTAGLVIGKIKRDEEGLKVYERGCLYLPDGVSDVLVIGTIAYAAVGPRGVVLIDVTNPSEPKPIERVVTKGAAVRLAKEGNLMAVSQGSAGVLLLDVSDPLNPTIRSSWQSKGYVYQVAFSPNDHNVLYVAEGREGIAKLTLNSSARLDFDYRHKCDGQIRSVMHVSDEVIVAGTSKGVIVLKGLKDRFAPITELVIGDIVRDLFAISEDRIAVAAGSEGVVIVKLSEEKADISDGYETEQPVNRILVKGDLLFAGNDSGGLVVLNVSKKDGLVKLYP